MAINWEYQIYKVTPPLFEKVWVPDTNLGNNTNENEQPCLHDSCSKCHGTGVSIHGGMCFHHISCNCPKCSWR